VEGDRGVTVIRRPAAVFLAGVFTLVVVEPMVVTDLVNLGLVLVRVAAVVVHVGLGLRVSEVLTVLANVVGLVVLGWLWTWGLEAVLELVTLDAVLETTIAVVLGVLIGGAVVLGVVMPGTF